VSEKKVLQTIDHAFDSRNIETVLASLERRGAGIRQIESVTSELTDMLPAAPFRRGDTFDTSFGALYDGLDELAKQRAREYWALKVEAVPAMQKKKYFKVFGK